ncbi:CGH_1_HP_G0084110.mRNA.1.CDS.1 [Saccharomyces cerevisiae]|nr:CGH_1_HP_G0084110.mRNA.1.CDS.1 [Saccharomyces cerevisiae]CAI6928577.1 CGH_1_HP_G0084110.mRNA.1.CDS.1 [Saccharomyces cerevisiae]
MLLTKRFSKLFKLTFIVLILCGLFVITNKYMDENTSVKEYKEYLDRYVQSYSNKYSSSSDAASADDSTPLRDNDEAGNEKLKSFYNNVFNFLMVDSPKGSTAKQYNEACLLKGDIGDRPDHYKDLYKLSAKELSKCLELSPDEVASLTKSHKDYVEHIATLVSPKGTYKGSGIATVGGGKFSLMAFLIIKTLRNMGTTLPVEVLIPPGDEGETEFCNKILPAITPSVFTFENLLLLDADNFPIKPLDNIFNEEPYVSTGLVMWPDFWRRTTHPLYYDIAGIAVDKKKRVRNSRDDITPPAVYTKDLKDLSDVPLSDPDGIIPDGSRNPPTDDKQTNLATAPNFILQRQWTNGTTQYFSKAVGEGDKETFTAAYFYGLTFYQVRTRIRR